MTARTCSASIGRMTNQEKIVRIACEGAGKLALDDLLPFQGELKSLAEEDFMRLRDRILANGFTSPIHVWRNEGKNFILDGHQRVRTLSEMRKLGYAVPTLPVDYIEAESYRKAKDVLLSHASQFGRVERDGLYEFVIDAGIDPGALAGFRLPEIDLPSFNAEFFHDGILDGEAATGAKELGSDGFSAFDHKCPRCGFEFDDGEAKE